MLRTFHSGSLLNLGRRAKVTVRDYRLNQDYAEKDR
jgi:hypothetical protein